MIPLKSRQFPLKITHVPNKILGQEVFFLYSLSTPHKGKGVFLMTPKKTLSVINHIKLLTPFTISLIYLVLGGLWILFSDQATHFLFKNPETVFKISLFKGWLFILTTALLLCFLISKLQTRIRVEGEYFRTLFDGINDSIFIHDPETGKILDVNQKTLEMYGYSKKEMLRFGIDQLSSGIPPYTLNEALKYLQKVSCGEPELFEWRCKRKDGSLFWGEVNMKLVRVHPADRIIVTLRNIDEWKKVQNTLKDNADTFGKLFHSNAILMAVSTIENGTYLDVNETFLSVLGYTREEVIQHTSHELKIWASPEDRKKALDIFSREGKVRGVETTILTRSGEIRNALFSIDRIVLNGKPCLLSTMTDFTKRKEAEKKLIFSESKLKRAERIAKIGHFEFNLETRAVTASEGAQIIYGLGNKTWTVENIQTIPLPEYREFLEKSIRELMEKNTPYNVEYKINRPTDQKIVDIRSMAEYDAEKRTIFGVIYDITETKKMKDSLEKAQKIESLGVLAGGIAHDFNNLLGGIFGYIELARLSASNPAAVVSNLNEALSIINQTRNLTLQLLTFAKGGGVRFKTQNLTPLLKQSTNFALSGSNVSPDFSFPPDLWFCEIDEAPIAQVIQNIVINAKQAMTTGGTVFVSAQNVNLNPEDLPLLKKGRYVRIEIRDQGPGIPKDILPRIFDPFFTTKAKGNGLGLSICYSIVQKHGGSLDVKSSPETGTTFIIHLQASSAAAQETKSEVQPLHKGGGTLLIMDDEDFIRDVCSGMLESMGYTVIKTKDGKEALEEYRKAQTSGPPLKAVFLDLTIPAGMGGKETAETMRMINKEVILIAMSGYSREDVMAHPARYGFTCSIQKPFTLDEISQVLNRLFPAPPAV